MCQTQYETSCVTRYKNTPVVENVEECVKIYKQVCQQVPSDGYGAEPSQVCRKEPVDDCKTVAKTVYKKLPDTTCERIPFEACAPDNCDFVPGPAECHNKTVDIGIDKVSGVISPRNNIINCQSFISARGGVRPPATEDV